MIKFFTFLICCILASSLHAGSLNVRDCRVYIVTLGKKTLDNKLWVMDYIIVNDSVFSGNYFTGYNLTCRLPQSTLDSILSVDTPDEEGVFKLKKKIDRLKMHSFRSKNHFLNSNFFWKCTSVEMKFVLAPCKIDTKDFLEEAYGDYNAIYPVSVDKKSFKICQSLPSSFFSFLERNVSQTTK